MIVFSSEAVIVAKFKRHFQGVEDSRRPRLNLEFPAERQPISCKLCCQESGIECELRPSIIRNVEGKLLHRIFIGHHGEQSVDDDRWRLKNRVRGADEDVDGREFGRKAVPVGVVEGGSPSEALLKKPDYGEPEVGGCDQEPVQHVGGGDVGETVIEEGELSGDKKKEVELVQASPRQHRSREKAAIINDGHLYRQLLLRR